MTLTESSVLPGGTAADLDEGCFVYGVVSVQDAEARLSRDLIGLDGQPVAVHALEGPAAVGVLTSEIPLDRPPGRGADLVAYQRLLDAVTAAGVAVAPVRFGTVMPDLAAITEELLVPHQDHFAQLLEDLRGRRQLVVQGRYDEQSLLREVVAADPEVARLRQLTKDLPAEAGHAERVRLGELVARAVEARQAADAGLVLDEVAPYADAIVERPVAGLERALDAALLVADAQLDALEVRLERLAEELHPRIQLQLSPPMAPYDFVEGG